MEQFNWYQQLVKPTWAPPSWLFGPVWTVLYAIIFFSFGAVFYKVYKKELYLAIALPFLFNLAFNFSFTFFQFTLQNNFLASVDIILVLITLVWALIAIYPKMKWVALVNIPYLLWVSFATFLQLTITSLNNRV